MLDAEGIKDKKNYFIKDAISSVDNDSFNQRDISKVNM